MLIKFITLLTTMLAIPLTASGATFTNPIVEHGPDPWLVHHDGNYYFISTSWSSKIVIRKSKTLAGLHSAADTTVFNLTETSGCCNMWAPELHLLDGPNGQRWYIYYAASRNITDYIPTQRIHVLESAALDPMGPYTFKADLRDPSDDSSYEIDPSILKVKGQLYLMGAYVRGEQHIFVRPLSNPWTASGKKVSLDFKSYKSWEIVGGITNEGPEALYNGNQTFIVYSTSACSTPDYKLGLLTLTGTDPLNPSHWTKSGPVFERSDANHVYGPGHNGFFVSPDGKENWIVYHANSDTNGTCGMNRSARAQKFGWNADGSPNFGAPVAVGVGQTSPSGE